MRLVSINVGTPREAAWKGTTVATAIFKEPVAGRILLRTLNLDGDRQADLSVHGGPDKAVYAYPVEHYAYWRPELNVDHLPFGSFGENFTVEGLDEENVHVGDRFRAGSAEVMATQPRLPCYKLGVKFGRDDIVKRFLASGRTGFYFAVLREGEVGAGDEILPLHRDPAGVTVAAITRLYTTDKHNRDGLRRAAQLAALPENWRRYFEERLASL